MTVAPGALTLCCADMDARPLFWTTEDGGRDGYEPSVAWLAADRLGLELRWAFRRWDRFRPSLEAGEVDAIWCGVAVTEERRGLYAFSRPYAAFDEGVLVAAGSPIDSADSLRGARIGAIEGSTNMRLAGRLGGVLVGFDGSSEDVFAEMLEAVRSGSVDAMVDDLPAFGGVLQTGEFRLVHVARTGNEWAAACRTVDRETVALLDEGIGRAVDDGSVAREWRRWFPDDPVPAVLEG